MKKNSKHTNALPMSRRTPFVPNGVKKGFRIYAAVVMVLALVFAFSVTAFSANNDPLSYLKKEVVTE